MEVIIETAFEDLVVTTGECRGDCGGLAGGVNGIGERDLRWQDAAGILCKNFEVRDQEDDLERGVNQVML